jgi:hypothetical protein
VLGEATSRPTLPHHSHHTGEKSARLLRVLRQKARATRNKKPKEFYSIREVASHFDVPATTVARIYTQLTAEGLLTTVWGSKTFITPTRINNELRIRGVVALPASLVSFSTHRYYRNFFCEIRDALWKFGFATQLLFYEENEAQLPLFAERLLKQNLDIAIWFLPNAKLKQTVARLLDRGISVITVADSADDCRGYGYCVDRQPAIRDALSSWRKDGIRSVTVMQNSRYRLSGTVTLLEKCLRDAAMPYSFANAESPDLEEALGAHAHVPSIIFPSSDVTVPFAARDPARFARLSERSRILLLDGAIDIPGLDAVPVSTEVVEVDSQTIAKQIVSDIIQSTRPRKTEPVIFRAKWIPGAINNRVATPNSVQSRCNAQAHT